MVNGMSDDEAIAQMYDELAVESDRERGLVDPSDLAELRRTAQEALGDGTPWSAEWETCDCQAGYPCSHGRYVEQIDLPGGHLEPTVDATTSNADLTRFSAACRHVAVFDPATVLALLDSLEQVACKWLAVCMRPELGGHSDADVEQAAWVIRLALTEWADDQDESATETYDQESPDEAALLRSYAMTARRMADGIRGFGPGPGR